jgi:hypothetical protein
MDIVNNTEFDLPVVVNVRDSNGLPVSGYAFSVVNSYNITRPDGTIMAGASALETEVSGIEVLAISNTMAGQHVVLNNRSVGLSKLIDTTVLTERYPVPSPTLLETDEYGSAYLDIHIVPRSEPVSKVTYTYEISGVNQGVSGTTEITFSVERKDIREDAITVGSGWYAVDDVTPHLEPHAYVEFLAYNDVMVDGWVYGGKAELYTVGDWYDQQPTYETIIGTPSGSSTILYTSGFSGDYVISYNEVKPTWL